MAYAEAPDPAASIRLARERPSRTGRAGMWVFLATDVMGFGALFIAYGVYRVRALAADEFRPSLDLAAAMTFLLLGSSATIAFAASSRRRAIRRWWLGATVALGAAFLGGVGGEYRQLWRATPPSRLGHDPVLSTFYVITAYHALHVAVGVVYLSARLVQRQTRALDVAALYWHFVDAAWMPILTFLYLFPRP